MEMNSPEIKDNDSQDVELVDYKKVSCHGIDGPMGHPKVYLDMGDKDFVVCPYCSKIFKLR